ncbi:MAG: hypothetical protein H7A39_00930 [Chlamydiales bacterium]|nr:hypothetical protein [Chlamydiales bacterium]
MKKGILLGALTGAIVAFVWSFLSWAVLPWHKTSFKDFCNAEEVAMVIKKNATCGQGVYLLPGCCGGDEEQFHKKYQCGPIMFAAVTPEGKNFNMAPNLIIQFITLFVAAGIISYIVASFTKSSYGFRLLIATLVGIFSAWMMAVPSWNWWSFPVSFSLVEFFDNTIMWFLAGLAIAKFAHHVKA